MYRAAVRLGDVDDSVEWRHDRLRFGRLVGVEEAADELRGALAEVIAGLEVSVELHCSRERRDAAHRQ